MSRRYDRQTTVFSPEGRLYQVDYVIEAIGHAGSAIGILSKDGLFTEKMYKIDDHVACAVAGIMSDANILINTARVQARRYAYAYQEPILSVTPSKELYTQFGGLSPFGVLFLFVGWDKNYVFQLFMSCSQDYKDDMTRQEAVQLALKVLRKTMDSTSLTSEKLELAEVFLLPSGKVKY
ncbi:proteasome subunit alpha type-4-A [Citrus sinensis]|uniref:Proteasome subunit alpha type-4-A n=1 Tax=Citrus sinensis TaxID=2711 RepID=A0ACB8NBB7_CITSI|nr:proteasome subunit alpha type-4-A [Citrus sinensis]